MEDLVLSCLESRVEGNRNLYARFLVGPFLKGDALTVATALRRVLLSSVESIGITALYIQGITHEFSTIAGVRESVLELSLNFQAIVLCYDKDFFQNKEFFDEIQIGYLQVQGPKVIYANDLKLPLGVKLVDPTQYIATVSKEGSIVLKFVIGKKNNLLRAFPLFNPELQNRFGFSSIPCKSSCVLPGRASTGQLGSPSLCTNSGRTKRVDGTSSPFTLLSKKMRRTARSNRFSLRENWLRGMLGSLGKNRFHVPKSTNLVRAQKKQLVACPIGARRCKTRTESNVRAAHKNRFLYRKNGSSTFANSRVLGCANLLALCPYGAVRTAMKPNLFRGDPLRVLPTGFAFGKITSELLPMLCKSKFCAKQWGTRKKLSTFTCKCHCQSLLVPIESRAKRGQPVTLRSKVRQNAFPLWGRAHSTAQQKNTSFYFPILGELVGKNITRAKRGCDGFTTNHFRTKTWLANLVPSTFSTGRSLNPFFKAIAFKDGERTAKGPLLSSMGQIKALFPNHLCFANRMCFANLRFAHSVLCKSSVLCFANRRFAQNVQIEDLQSTEDLQSKGGTGLRAQRTAPQGRAQDLPCKDKERERVGTKTNLSILGIDTPVKQPKCNSFAKKSRFLSKNKVFKSDICLRNIIPLDLTLTPILKVNFVVEIDDEVLYLRQKIRERIILEVWTNGSIHPRQAVHNAALSLTDMFSSFRSVYQVKSYFLPLFKIKKCNKIFLSRFPVNKNLSQDRNDIAKQDRTSIKRIAQLPLNQLQLRGLCKNVSPFLTPSLFSPPFNRFGLSQSKTLFHSTTKSSLSALLTSHKLRCNVGNPLRGLGFATAKSSGNAPFTPFSYLGQKQIDFAKANNTRANIGFPGNSKNGKGLWHTRTGEEKPGTRLAFSTGTQLSNSVKGTFFLSKTEASVTKNVSLSCKASFCKKRMRNRVPITQKTLSFNRILSPSCFVKKAGRSNLGKQANLYPFERKLAKEVRTVHPLSKKEINHNFIYRTKLERKSLFFSDLGELALPVNVYYFLKKKGIEKLSTLTNFSSFDLLLFLEGNTEIFYIVKRFLLKHNLSLFQKRLF